jgi:phage shock protein A
MVGRLVEQVNRLIRSGVASVTGETPDPAAQRAFALNLVRDKLGKLIVERRRLTRQLTELPAAASELTAKAELAVRKGREDLARAAMAEVASMTSGRAGLADDIASLDADIAMLEDAIGQLTNTQPKSLLKTDDDAKLSALLAELDRLAADERQKEQSQER